MEQEPMNQRPLHQLLQNSNLNLLEAALPYVPGTMRRPLAMYIKFSEMTEVMNGFENEEVLAACGLDDQNMNYEMMLQAMRMSASKEQSEKLEQMIRIMNLSKMIPSMFENAVSPQPNTQVPNQANQQADLMKKLAGLMQMNQQGQTNTSTQGVNPNQYSSKNSPIDALMSDPRTATISPEKLQFIRSFVQGNQNKSPEEMLPQMMQLNSQMQSQGLSFDKNEMELLLDILKGSMTPEERNQIDMILKMLG